MSCQGFIQCILKLINFLVTLVGALMIVYSLWMLKEWSSFGPHDQETLVNAPALLSGGDISMSSDGVQLTEGFMVEPIARPLLKEGLYISKLPAPWYVTRPIYQYMPPFTRFALRLSPKCVYISVFRNFLNAFWP